MNQPGPPDEPPVETVEVEPIPAPDRRAADHAARRHALAARDRRRAWAIAIGADVLQWVLFPLFLGGGAAPWDVGLDLFVAFAMIRLLGFHIAFAPAFLLELVPIANFVPSWTLAVLIVTRLRGKPRD